MHAKLFRPHQYFSNPIGSIISILLLSLFIPRHDAKTDLKLYEACRNMPTSPCGKPIKGKLDYPFWVEQDIPRSDCGLKEFKLSCEETNLVVDMGSNDKYRVLGIDPKAGVLSLNHYNDILETICESSTSQVEGTKLNEMLYNYSPSTEFVDLFYHCGNDDIITTGIKSNITCGDDEKYQVYFFRKDSPTPYEREKPTSCSSTKLPVSKKLFEEFTSNKIQPQVVLEGGFEVQYNNKVDLKICEECYEAGGLCWRDTYVASNDKCLYPRSGNKNNTKLIVGIIAGVLVGGSILLLMVLITICRWVKTKNGSTLFSQDAPSYPKDVEAFIKQYGSSIPTRFRYSTLKKITDSFKAEIGKGGYGNVYRGCLADGQVVAVKVLKEAKGNGEEFVNEVASIGRTSHVNVVTLLGFCYEGKRRALVYEFMPNGSLEKFIYGTTPSLEGQHLGWDKLFSIATGIARGLEYLHRGCNTRILHFDIKPHNILLDKDFRPKISDFGLAKLYTRDGSAMSSLLQARGTIGYIAPEVASRNFGQVSHKSDVYSYGMMILEMVGGRKNVNASAGHTSEIYYPRWLYKRIQSDDVLNLANEISAEENEIVRKMVIIGLWCIQIYPSQRPSISKVIEMLEGHTTALEIPPHPYLCSVPSSPSNSQKELVFSSFSVTKPTSSA